MDIADIKKLPIIEYLAEKNHHPSRIRNYYLMYYSPFRDERTPSFKVDSDKNLWYDFGSGEGGSVIDLVMKMERCTLKEAIDRLKNRLGCISPSVIRSPIKTADTEPMITISKVLPLKNKSLTYYLYQRKIKISIARKYCSEVYYTLHDKNYYAIGFKNDTGGYELRNRYFKGSTSKDVTTIRYDNSSCLIFEGFIDFLSFLTFENVEYTKHNVIVLNSAVNCKKILKELPCFTRIYAYLDHDRTGKGILALMQSANTSVDDQSVIYLPYKDFNEFLCKR